MRRFKDIAIIGVIFFALIYGGSQLVGAIWPVSEDTPFLQNPEDIYATGTTLLAIFGVPYYVWVKHYKVKKPDNS